MTENFERNRKSDFMILLCFSPCHVSKTFQCMNSDSLDTINAAAFFNLQRKCIFSKRYPVSQIMLMNPAI